MARKTTIKAFEGWIADVANEARVLELVAGGLTLQKTSVAVKQPYTCLHRHFHSTGELEARYLAARKSFADGKMDENHAIADGVKPDRDHVAKAKLRVEVNTAAAKAYHRERWGEKVQVEKSVVVSADAALVGFARELLAKRRPLVLENEIAPGRVLEAPPLGAGSPLPAATPAPAVVEDVNE